MALIALAAAATLPRLTVPYKTPQPPEVTFLEQQRARSIESGQTIVVLRQGQKLVSSPGPGEMTMEGGRDLIIVRPAKSGYLDQQMVTTFYPDGTGLWSEFTIVRQDITGTTVLYNVRTDPLHGEIIYVSP